MYASVNAMKKFLSLLTISLFLVSVACIAGESVNGVRMLAAHNQVRIRHRIPPMYWSPSLAKAAAGWAQHLALQRGCAMQHVQGTGQGENLFWASAVTWSDGRRDLQSVTAEQVVKSWAAEEADYNYAANRCRSGKECGHYTQIVWKTSRELGCAMRTCRDKSQIWVCRYYPPGNWVGERPY